MSTASVYTPPSGSPSPWENLKATGLQTADTFESAFPPAMAQLGDFIYVAVIGSLNDIYWSAPNATSEILHNDAAWDSFWESEAATDPDWQKVDQATSTRPLSLAVFDNTLYLCYLGDGNNDINIYGIAGENSGVYYQIPGVSAMYATVVKEGKQLSVYYVDASDSTLWRTSTSSPEATPTKNNHSWDSDPINYQSGTKDGSPTYSSQTASGPLAVAYADGVTTIAYQGGKLGNKDQSDTIYMSTSAQGAQFTPDYWTINAYTNPGQRTNIGLGINNDAQYLTIGYTSASDATVLQLDRLVYTPIIGSNGQGAYTASASTTVPLPYGNSSENVSLLQVNASSGPALLLGGSPGYEEYPFTVISSEITISSDGDVGLSDVATQPTASDGTLPVMLADGSTVSTLLPSGITSVFNGSLSFTVSGVTPGGTTDALINLPVAYSGDGNAYVRYNYATGRFEDYRDTQGNPLYAFTDTDSDGVRDAITLTLADGDARWDRDGVANGSVVDFGFLASGAIEITGDRGNNRFTGNILANQIHGKGKRDVLIGDLGDDILRGGTGDDRLNGGEGADRLIGGGDVDRFIYGSLIDSTVDRPDTLHFGRRDLIDLRQVDAIATRKGNQAFSFIDDAEFSGKAGELRLFESRLLADVDGDQQADFVLNLRNSQAFSADALML